MLLSSIKISMLGLVMVKRGLDRSGSDAAFFNESMVRDAMSGMRIVAALENERCLRCAGKRKPTARGRSREIPK